MISNVIEYFLTTNIIIFNSEPHSILAPEAPPIPKEELERMIREKMGDKDAGDGRRAESHHVPQQERYNLILYVLDRHASRRLVLL